MDGRPPPSDGHGDGGGRSGRGRSDRGRAAHRSGTEAERLCCEALLREGWAVLLRRARTPLGEVDIVAERAGLLAFVEVKRRPRLGAAADALTPRQQRRLAAAAEIVLARHPDWRHDSMRFDLMVVDERGTVRRIADAFRIEG